MQFVSMHSRLLFLEIIVYVCTCFLFRNVYSDTSLTVYQDGTGNFTSIQTAIDWLNPGVNGPSLGSVILYLKGYFWERVHIYSNFTNGFRIIGTTANSSRSTRNTTPTTTPSSLSHLPYPPMNDPSQYDFIMYNVSGNSGAGTFNSWTCLIDANNVTLENIVIGNSANNYNKTAAGQSVALHLTGDRIAVYNSYLYGGQDTLYTGRYRSFYSHVYVNGSCDAIFGEGSAIFESSTIVMLNTVTAQKGNGTTAYIFNNSYIDSIEGKNTLLLGRPWGPQSSTIFQNSYMTDGIAPLGWDDWQHSCTSGHSTWCNETFYAEYNNSGPGYVPKARPWWTYQLNGTQDSQWTMARIFYDWVPSFTTL